MHSNVAEARMLRTRPKVNPFVHLRRKPARSVARVSYDKNRNPRLGPNRLLWTATAF